MTEFVRKRKNGYNAFPTSAKIHFSEKIYFGVRGTLNKTNQKHFYSDRTPKETKDKNNKSRAA